MQAQLITIDSSHAGQRIDNFLMSFLKGVPRSRLYRALRQGEVRVNKGRVQAIYRLKLGDVVRIPPIRTGEQKNPISPSVGLKQHLQAAILLETEDYLVINKPVGLAVHGGSAVSIGLIEALRALKPEFKNLFLVHRLDRETSGCLLLAKNRSSLLALQAAFKAREIEKSYLLFVHGKWPKNKRHIAIPLSKKEVGGERLVVVDLHGKMAETIFEPVQYFPTITLVRAQLITGRMHQIRVHAKEVGCPIVGDRKYGDKKRDQAVMKIMPSRRLFLHAKQLCFEDPIHPGRRVQVIAPCGDFEIDEPKTTQND